MATYYKYKSREGQDQVDWGTVTKGITDEISRVKGERDDKRKDVEDAAVERLEAISNKHQGPDVLENENIASYAAQQEAMAREDLAMLKSGDLTLQQYTSRINTAQGGTERMFQLSKKYQDASQQQLDSLKPDENGIIQASGLNAVYKQMVERFADPGKTKYYVDPETRESFLAVVTDKKGDGTVMIGNQAHSIMGISAAENIIQQNDLRYQSNSNAKILADEAGVLITADMLGNVGTKEDSYRRMFEGKELTADGNAIMSQIKLSFGSNAAYSSMLFDTLGYVPIAENENGSGFTNLVTGEIINKKPEKSFLVNTVNGVQTPQINEELKDVAHKGVLAQIKAKLDIKETVNPNLMTKYQNAMLGLKRQELADLQNEKSDAMNVQVRTMADLYSGDQVNVKAATEYFRDINPSVSLVERIPGGISVTYTDENGTTVKRPVVFGIENPKFNSAIDEGPDNTRFSMIENTNFDESQPEGPDNQKLIPEIKNQRDFILSAGNLLIGSDEAKKREFTKIVNAKNSDGQFVLNETLSNVSAGSAAEITETPKQQKFDIAFDTYLDEKLEDEIFSKKEVKLKESLTKIFTDMGLNASPIGDSISNEVLITVRGYTGDPLRIDGNNYTTSGKAIEKEKLKKYLRLVFKQRPDLSDTLKIKDTEGNQVLFTPDPVKKTKGFG